MADFTPTAPREAGSGVGSTYMVQGTCRQCLTPGPVFRSGGRCDRCVNTPRWREQNLQDQRQAQRAAQARRVR